MNDFFQSNRIICGRYQTALQEKFLPAVTSDSFSDSDKKNPQKFYLEFKKRALEVVTEESKKLLDETLKSNNSCLLLLKRTALVDTIVLAAFQTAVWFHNYLTQKNIDAKEVPVAIVARGGYGREEMYFQSDVDLQIVSKSLLEKSALDLAQGVIKQL